MNQAEEQILASLLEARKSIVSVVERVNPQIQYLISLRDSMNVILDKMAPLMEQVESGKSGFVVNPKKDTEILEKAIADPQSSPAEIVPDILIPPERESLWERMARLMRGMDRFTMSQAGKAAENEMGKSLGPNRPQTVRNSLVRHPETFRRNDDGTWTVIANEKEASMTETS